MYRNILIATDGSDLAGKAVTHGISLAKDQGASVTFVVVTPNWSAMEMADRAEHGQDHPVEVYEKRAADWAANVLAPCEKEARTAGVTSTSAHVKDKPAAEGILDAATSRGCDLIVLASHGRSGVQRLLLGSVATKVLTFSKVPVLICR